MEHNVAASLVAPLWALLLHNGKEFKNALLRDLMRLCRIRLRYTPPYHPRGNYTERVNRFIGESIRAMVNSPSGKKQDWHKFSVAANATKILEYVEYGP